MRRRIKLSVRVARAGGESAARVGLTQDDNPYPEGAEQRLEWERDFFAQKEEIRQSRELMRRLRDSVKNMKRSKKNG